MALATRFSKATGIKVKVVPHPTASDASYSQLARVFTSHGSSFDVAMIDVVWPGAFAPYLVDLKPKLGAQSRLHAAGIVANDTVGGRLVAMPWFGDFGILYYRTDLLQKYGYSAPPTTWAQLFAMAKKIQDGEQGSNPQFSGFVFQGNSYEGLTCDALEWIASSGGGQFIDGGKVTINNPKAAAILDLFRQNIGVTTPRGVTSYQEGEAHTAFVTGNAAFMRNWPYAYSIAADPKQSKVVGKFSVTTLPHGPGGAARRHRGRLAARGQQVLEAPGRGDRVRPLHDEPGRREVRRDHQHERSHDPGRGQGSGRREGESVPQAADRNGRARHASGAIPRGALQRGLEGHLPGDQPDPQRRVGEQRAAVDPVEAGAARQEVGEPDPDGGGWRLPSSPVLLR